jgi:signal transduction histidine kinase
MGAPRSLIDTRLALGGYAVIATTGGFGLAAWGPIWLGAHLDGQPWGKAALIRMCGAVVMAAGLCARGLAAADAASRLRGLSWFIGAHAVLWLMLVFQIRGPWGDVPVVGQIAWALLAVILALLYARLPAESAPSGPGSLRRSPHEQQIRDAAAQEERKRLARDLHDAIKQQIFAIQTSAAAAEARFDTDTPGVRDAVAQIRRSAREAMTELEAMLDHLRVEPVENVSLVDAIRKQCEALAFRTGAKVDLRVGTLPPTDGLDDGAYPAIFRITQEAFANIARHARARHVMVSLDADPGGFQTRILDAAPGRFVVRIEDDGVGIRGGMEGPGMGIQNMRARAAEIRGTLDVHDRAGGGTVVAFDVMCADPEELRAGALSVAITFGLCGIASLAAVFTRGFGFDGVLLAVFVLGFAHNLLRYRRLRRPDLRRPEAAESRP